VPEVKGRAVRLDLIGLFLAGFINTFLAPFFAVVVFGPGTPAGQDNLLQRVAWIADHPDRWQGGWLFWFAVTLSFAWSYYALGRHLNSPRRWPALAIGVALIAAAVDLVGVLVNITVLPEIASALTASPAAADPTLLILFQALEKLTNALTNVAAFGLYSLAGLLLLPALFATADYPRRLAQLGAVEWIISTIASLLLAFAPQVATVPMLIGFALYAPWVWASALWLMRLNNKEKS
jgi:hypothetical protein